MKTGPLWEVEAQGGGEVGKVKRLSCLGDKCKIVRSVL